MSKTNFDQYLEQQLKDPEFARGFAEADQAWDLALQIARCRERAGLSQAALAKRVGTTQQQISRLERPGYRGSLSTLERVATALGVAVKVRLTPLPDRDSRKPGKARKPIKSAGDSRARPTKVTTSK